MPSNDNCVKISAATTLTSPSVAITAVVLSMLAASPDYDRLYKDFDNSSRGFYEISHCTDQSPTMELLLKERANKLYTKLCAKIDKYAELSDGWNGYDALPIPVKTIASAKQFLQNMLADHIDLEGWEVFPTGRESIQFEKDFHVVSGLNNQEIVKQALINIRVGVIHIECCRNALNA